MKFNFHMQLHELDELRGHVVVDNEREAREAIWKAIREALDPDLKVAAAPSKPQAEAQPVAPAKKTSRWDAYKRLWFGL